MKSNYAEVFRHEQAVSKYVDGVYASGSYAWIVNERQRVWLRRLITESFGSEKPVLHDFACGNGRVITSLMGVVREAHGYDTSPAMLERARNDGINAVLHLVQEEGPPSLPEPAGGPSVVTAFRFLLNTGQAARDRLMAFAAHALPRPDSGLLVIENHGNRRSLRHVLNRRSESEWFNELGIEEVRAMLTRHGFELICTRGFTLLPRRAYSFSKLRGLIARLDAFLVRSPRIAGSCVNVVYVARRRP